MIVIPLSYDLLKVTEGELIRRCKEHIAKVWVTREMFEPIFDRVTIGQPQTKGAVATVMLSVIERGSGFNRAPEWYTKVFHYSIHESGVTEIIYTTTWGKMPEASVYSSPIAEWASSIRYPTAHVVSWQPTIPSPPPPLYSDIPPMPPSSTYI